MGRLVSFLRARARWLAPAVVAALLLVAAGYVVLLRIPAPGVAAYEPATDRPVAVDAPVSIRFDAPMDQASVERALAIEPPTEVAYRWDGERLEVRPAAGAWSHGTRYSVRLDRGARGVLFAPLRAPLEFSFLTAAPLAVRAIYPSPDAGEVGTDATVTVQFNNPVVALGLRESSLSPLRLEPATLGRGTWITTSTYLFRPSTPLRPATRYVATVPAGIADTTGDRLGADVAWAFTTRAPAVEDVEPADNARFVDPAGAIKVSFNQPMDRASAEAAFRLTSADDQAVPGQLSWESPSKLTFRPAAALRPEAKYRLSVSADARGEGGAVGLASSFTASFTTIGPPAVVGTAPKSGDKVEGAVFVTFSYPMDQEATEAAISVEPKPESIGFHWMDSDARVQLAWARRPATRYTVTIGPGARGRHGHPLEGQLPHRFSFTTPDLPPFVQLVGTGFVGTYSAYSAPEVYVRHRNVPSVDLALYRLSEEDFLRLAREPHRAERDFSPAESALVRHWQLKLPADSPRNELSQVKTPLAERAGGKLEPGRYLLKALGLTPDSRVDPGGLSSFQILTVSRTGLVLKRTESQVLVWAVDLATGEPRPGLELAADWVSMRPGGGRGELGRGRTDASGLWLLGHSRIDPSERQVLVRGAEGEDFTAVFSQWTSDIAPYHFGLSSQPENQRLRGYLYTERPIYRPGQTVYFKGILRADDDGAYSPPPPGTSVHLDVHDQQGKAVYSGDFATDAFGAFHGELPVSEGATLGMYRLEARVGDPPKGDVPADQRPYYFGASFAVAEYRKPDFLVKVALDRPGYVHGDTIRGTARAEYYFGAPVVGAKVRWRVISRDYWVQIGERYDFVDYPERRWWESVPQNETGLRAEGQGITGPDGSFAFELRADVGKDDLGQVFTVEASVLDPNNQEVSERTDVPVHKATYYAGLRADSYVGRIGRPMAVGVLAVSAAGEQPMASRSDRGAGDEVTPALLPRPGAPLKLSLYHRKWLSVKQKHPDGWYYWESKHEDTLVASKDVVTDAEGKARVELTPDRAGTFRVVVEGRDERGNLVRSATYFYATGGEYVGWQMASHDRIELIPDKPEYRVGETARVMVPSPVEGPLALVTLERGKVIQREVRTLPGNSAVLEIPIRAEHVPNLYVSTALVKAQPDGQPISFKLGYAALKVSADEKTLRIAVAADRPRYEPGETITYRITTTDRHGRPAPAQLSLALVDAAVLALADDTSGDVVKTFYGLRPLGVQTASSLVLSIDRLNADLAKGIKGAGGGPAGPSTVRTKFPDTAYWSATVETDASGQAVVPVKLPDSLTTWRLRVRGVTANTLVGSADHDVAASKSLLVRPVAPRFLVAGDEARIEAIVHNYTEREVEARVSLDASGVRSTGEPLAPRIVRVPSGGSVKVGWTVAAGLPGELSQAGPAAGAALSFTVEPTAADGPPGDALRLTLPVHEGAALQTVAASSGELAADAGAVTEVFKLPDVEHSRLGAVTLETTPSLAAGLRYSLWYLDEYPYECTEQVVSRFLPRLALSRAFGELGLPDPQGLKTRLPDVVLRSVQRLQKEQRPDGGWGWWPETESQPTISAYALLGLAEARREGYAVDEDTLQRAAKYLRQHLDRPVDERDGADLDARAFVLDAMAESGYGDLGLLRSLYERRGALGQYGRAFLALGLLAQDQAGTKGEVGAIVSELVSAGRWTASSAHWEEAKADPRAMNTHARTTAIVLRALVRADPGNPTIPAAVRWLMVARKEGHWETTQETAWSLLALTNYLEASGELGADFGYAVQLNGETLTTARVAKGNLDDVITLRLDVARLLQDENRLHVARLKPEAGQTGQGRLYYTLRAKYLATAGELLAEDRGIAVLREYLRPEAEDEGPVAAVGAGDLVKVRLTILLPSEAHYLALEDHLPAGLEAVDARLKTSSLVAQRQTGLKVKEAEAAKSQPGPKSGRPYHFERSEVRDDRVTVFATYLPRGSYEYTYLARATTSGRFQALPAAAYEMYSPEVWGRSAGTTFVVR